MSIFSDEPQEIQHLFFLKQYCIEFNLDYEAQLNQLKYPNHPLVLFFQLQYEFERGFGAKERDEAVQIYLDEINKLSGEDPALLYAKGMLKLKRYTGVGVITEKEEEEGKDLLLRAAENGWSPALLHLAAKDFQLGEKESGIEKLKEGTCYITKLRLAYALFLDGKKDEARTLILSLKHPEQILFARQAGMENLVEFYAESVFNKYLEKKELYLLKPIRDLALWGSKPVPDFITADNSFHVLHINKEFMPYIRNKKLLTDMKRAEKGSADQDALGIFLEKCQQGSVFFEGHKFTGSEFSRIESVKNYWLEKLGDEEKLEKIARYVISELARPITSMFTQLFEKTTQGSFEVKKIEEDEKNYFFNLSVSEDFLFVSVSTGNHKILRVDKKIGEKITFDDLHINSSAIYRLGLEENSNMELQELNFSAYGPSHTEILYAALNEEKFKELSLLKELPHEATLLFDAIKTPCFFAAISALEVFYPNRLPIVGGTLVSNKELIWVKTNYDNLKNANNSISEKNPDDLFSEETKDFNEKFILFSQNVDNAIKKLKGLFGSPYLQIQEKLQIKTKALYIELLRVNIIPDFEKLNKVLEFFSISTSEFRGICSVIKFYDLDLYSGFKRSIFKGLDLELSKDCFLTDDGEIFCKSLGELCSVEKHQCTRLDFLFFGENANEKIEEIRKAILNARMAREVIDAKDEDNDYRNVLSALNKITIEIKAELEACLPELFLIQEGSCIYTLEKYIDRRASKDTLGFVYEIYKKLSDKWPKKSEDFRGFSEKFYQFINSIDIKTRESLALNGDKDSKIILQNCKKIENLEDYIQGVCSQLGSIKSNEKNINNMREFLHSVKVDSWFFENLLPFLFEQIKLVSEKRKKTYFDSLNVLVNSAFFRVAYSWGQSLSQDKILVFNGDSIKEIKNKSLFQKIEAVIAECEQNNRDDEPYLAYARTYFLNGCKNGRFSLVGVNFSGLNEEDIQAYFFNKLGLNETQFNRMTKNLIQYLPSLYLLGFDEWHLDDEGDFVDFNKPSRPDYKPKIFITPSLVGSVFSLVISTGPIKFFNNLGNDYNLGVCFFSRWKLDLNSEGGFVLESCGFFSKSYYHPVLVAILNQIVLNDDLNERIADPAENHLMSTDPIDPIVSTLRNFKFHEVTQALAPDYSTQIFIENISSDNSNKWRAWHDFLTHIIPPNKKEQEEQIDLLLNAFLITQRELRVLCDFIKIFGKKEISHKLIAIIEDRLCEFKPCSLSVSSSSSSESGMLKSTERAFQETNRVKVSAIAHLSREGSNPNLFPANKKPQQELGGEESLSSTSSSSSSNNNLSPSMLKLISRSSSQNDKQNKDKAQGNLSRAHSNFNKSLGLSSSESIRIVNTSSTSSSSSSSMNPFFSSSPSSSSASSSPSPSGSLSVLSIFSADSAQQKSEEGGVVLLESPRSPTSKSLGNK